MAQILHDSFEGGWTHLAHVFPDGGQPYLTELGNVFTPEGWVTWFVHGGENGYVQPEVRDARDHDPDRMHSGENTERISRIGSTPLAVSCMSVYRNDPLTY